MKLTYEPVPCRLQIGVLKGPFLWTEVFRRFLHLSFLSGSTCLKPVALTPGTRFPMRVRDMPVAEKNIEKGHFHLFCPPTTDKYIAAKLKKGIEENLEKMAK